MNPQQSLFGASNLARTVQIPPAPKELTPHADWPYPGMTQEESARAALVMSSEYQEMLAAVFNAGGCGPITTKQLLASVPKDWRDLCGKYAHANIANWTAKKHGIESIYVHHDGGGFHFEYRAGGEA